MAVIALLQPLQCHLKLKSGIIVLYAMVQDSVNHVVGLVKVVLKMVNVMFVILQATESVLDVKVKVDGIFKKQCK